MATQGTSIYASPATAGVPWAALVFRELRRDAAPPAPRGARGLPDRGLRLSLTCSD